VIAATVDQLLALYPYAIALVFVVAVIHAVVEHFDLDLLGATSSSRELSDGNAGTGSSSPRGSSRFEGAALDENYARIHLGYSTYTTRHRRSY